MNWRAIVAAPVRGLKAFTTMVFRQSSSAWQWLTVPNSTLDWTSVGDGTGSSTVTAPLFWVARTFPEAPPMLWRKMDNGQEEAERQHPLLRLLERPNPHHTGVVQWMATTVDWMVDGNAYWLKLRTKGGTVAQLWWVPSWLIEPKGSERQFISHYEYRPGVETLDLAPSDLVHFRFGLDSDNPRKGLSPLKSVLREVFTDDEAANFTASLLRNMGVPGLVVSPKGEQQPSPEDVKATKAYLKANFTGDNRGEPMVMSGPTEVAQFGFSPEQLLLRELRRIPEERVTAVMGVPAIVAGLGAGLDRSTFTNMAEAREAAYESGIIPMQRILAEEIRFQLLPEFEPDPFVWRFGFDTTKVRVLQEDLYRQAQRLDLAVRGGWGKRSEARRLMGLEVGDRDDVYLIPLNTAEVPASGPLPEPAEPGGNGNGAPGVREIAEQVVREMATTGS